MRKLKLQMDVTVDGFVTGPNNELDWMTFDMKDNKAMDDLNKIIDSSGTLLMGRKMTDEFMDYWTGVKPESPEYEFAQKMVDVPKIVFSKTVKESRWINTTVTDDDLVKKVNELKAEDGKDILVYGGVSFASSLIDNNLIDEYHFFVNPTAIGNGKSIFGGTTKLKLAGSASYDCGVVLNSYESA